MAASGLKVQIADLMQLERALHDPTWRIRVLSSKTIFVFQKNKINIRYFLTTNTSLALALWLLLGNHVERSHTLVLCLCTSVQKGRVGWKTPSNFLLQLQNRPTSCFTFLCKGRLTFFARSLCKHWVGNSSVWPFLCDTNVFFFENDRYFCQIRPLFLDWGHVEPFEAALNSNLILQHVGHHWSPLYAEKILECFPQKPNFVSTEERKTWTSWVTSGWVNYQDIFIRIYSFIRFLTASISE